MKREIPRIKEGEEVVYFHREEGEIFGYFSRMNKKSIYLLQRDGTSREVSQSDVVYIQPAPGRKE